MLTIGFIEELRMVREKTAYSTRDELPMRIAEIADSSQPVRLDSATRVGIVTPPGIAVR
jgi:hypothetical protein